MKANYAGTRGNPHGQIMVVAESYGANEERQNQPLVGASGQELNKIFSEVGIDEHDVFFTNVINARPSMNDMKQFFYPTREAREKKLLPTRGLYPRPMVEAGVRELKTLIAEINPKLIIGLGNYTLWALTEDCFGVGNQSDKFKRGYKVPTGIGQWRGSQLRDSTFGIPFLPTYHPAATFRQWSWRTLLKYDLGLRVPLALNNQWDEPQRRFIVKPTFKETVDTLRMLIANADKGKLPLAVDLETRHSLIACIGLAWSRLDAICVPLMTSEAPGHYWQPHEELEIVKLLRHLLTHSNVVIMGQNFLYDAQYLVWQLQILPKISFDTMIMQHLIFPGTPLALYHISSLNCKYHRYWKDEGKNWEPGMDEAQLWEYNCRDCVVTFECVEELIQQIQYYEFTEQFSWQMRQLASILRMMLRGVNINKQTKLDMTIELMEIESEFGAVLERMVPEDVLPRDPKKSVWYRSPTQQVDLFYTALGCDVITDPKTKSPTVNDEALEELHAGNYLLRTMIEKLQQYRSLKIFHDFASMKLGPDGRMRSSFTPTAETFRWKSSEDAFGSGRNLQNIPKGREE